MELQFKNVTKDYGNVHAVEHVTHSMGKGVYGLLGSKWSGKNHFNADDMYSDNSNKRRKSCGMERISLVWGASYRKYSVICRRVMGFILIFRCMTTCCILHLSKESEPIMAKEKGIKTVWSRSEWLKRGKKDADFIRGMIRRVGIARAMLNDPGYLCWMNRQQVLTRMRESGSVI